MTSFSQTIKENIKTQSKDPKTAENAAKADVYILENKKKVTDTAPASANTDRNTKHKRKKKHSRRKG